MNPKRLILAIAAVFATVWVADLLIHWFWLYQDYIATASMWRDESGMKQHMGWMTLAQLLWSATFVMIWAQGFAKRECFKCAIIYGVMMGLFFQTNTLVLYAVQPLPGALLAKWFAANVSASVLAGIITFFVYKPRKNPVDCGC